MNNPYLSLLKTSWKYAEQKRKRFVLIYSMFVVANITVAMNPILYGWFINHLQMEGTDGLSSAWIYVAAFLGLRLLEWSFHGPARVMERKLAFYIAGNFLQELYHQILRLPMNWHQDNHSGYTINRVRKGYESLKEFFQSGFIHLYSIGKFFFSFAAMVYFSPLFGFIGVLLGIFTVWVIFIFDKPFIKAVREMNEKEHQVSSTLFDSLSNIVTVITLRLEKRMEVSLLEKVRNVFPAFCRNVFINEWKWFTAQMLIGITYSVLIVGYVYQNYQPGQVFLIGGLITLIGFVNQFTTAFNDIALHYTKVLTYHTDLKMAQAFSQAFHDQKRTSTSLGLPDDWKNLEIKNLNFSRTVIEGNDDLRNTTGLKGLHFHIEKGSKIAFIGESGSGKSTLLALLRGLYQPDANVELSLNDGQKVLFEKINNSVTLFPQEPEIFENSILYNITLGLPFSEEEVMKVCENAQFAEVVKQLPNGLHTHIQEKGVNLSGGQKQRLALARGILAAKTSSIVLLDEPTSSVDPKTEIQIYEKLFNDFKDKAILSSLHRLHLLTKFDYVYILDKGKIVDEGTFFELREKSFLFKELWNHQEDKGAITLSTNFFE